MPQPDSGTVSFVLMPSDMQGRSLWLLLLVLVCEKQAWPAQQHSVAIQTAFLFGGMLGFTKPSTQPGPRNNCGLIIRSV